MWQVENRFRVRLGGNTYINCDELITVRGEPLFTLKRHDDGYLGIYFDIYNAEGYKIASVKRNEIYYGGKDKNRYVIDGSMNRYVLTDQSTKQIICDIRKRENAQPAELDVSVLLYTRFGFLFNATPDQTNFSGVVMRGCVIEDCGVGIAIE